MRLRKETGDYSIKFTPTTNPVLPKNLLAEDLLGAVIEEASSGKKYIVFTVEDNADNVILYCGATDPYNYVKATGVVTVMNI